MSFIPSFFIVLLCLSMHATTARHFGLIKAGEMAEGKKESIGEAIDGGVTVMGTQEPNIDSKFVRDSTGQAPVKPVVIGSNSWKVPSKISHFPPGFHYSDYSMPRMRDDEQYEQMVLKSSSLSVPLEATNVKESTTRRRRRLSVVRFGSKVKKANNHESQEEDDVIDYSPVRGTPPIHNINIPN